MLETIREYAHERLEESGEAEELRRRHARRFLALAEEADPRPREGREWLDRLEPGARQPSSRLRPARGLRRERGGPAAGRSALDLWDARGYVAEGRRRPESALRGDERPPAACARALTGATV